MTGGEQACGRCLPVLALALAALLGGAPAPASEPHDHAEHSQHDPASAALAPSAPSSDSIYQLSSLWTAQDGRKVPLSTLAGRVQVLALVYTHCEHACPRIIADMRRLRSELGGAGGRVGYVLVSLDPERDDAQRLATFARKTGLGEGWTLLRAEEGSVRELAAVLGIRYRRVSETDFVHSNLLSVLDQKGVVIHRQVGLGVDPGAAADAIRALLASDG